MRHFKRSQYVLVTFEDIDCVDPNGASASPGEASWVITSLLSGEHVLSDADELDRVRRVPSSSWTSEESLISENFEPARLESLATLGIFLSDSQGLELSRMRLKEERLQASGWPPCAAMFHLLSQHQETQSASAGSYHDTGLQEREAERRAERFIESRGLPPPAFFEHPGAGEKVELPSSDRQTPLASVLLRRRTSRYFEPEEMIGRDTLSDILRLTFAPNATRSLAGGRIQLLMKTSPSGGSLHPIEAYPLLFRSDAAAPGLYHYDTQRHALALLRAFPEEVARRLAVYCAQGQKFVGSCALVVILVARFDRNFWKYRERENSYAVVLQDAGHLSQTFQLLATELGLGSFYTAAINSGALVELLNLEYPAQAPIGILGLGVPSPAPTAGVPIPRPGQGR